MLKRKVIAWTSAIAVGAIIFVVYQSIHAKQFLLSTVEMESPPQGHPVTLDELSALAAIPVEAANLFVLPLGPIRTRLLSHPWIENVLLKKKFPQTLAVQVEYREPVALVQRKDGATAYLDRSGKVFGDFDVEHPFDLPILAGVEGESQGDLRLRALTLMESWERVLSPQNVELAGLDWTQQAGFQAFGVYRGGTGASSRAHRVLVELGKSHLSDKGAALSRLAQVFMYLREKNVAARQIFVGESEKIVVKTARGF